jgi:predicted dehydrogenase
MPWPAILLSSHLFMPKSICDVSTKMVDHYATKFCTPHKTTTPHELVDHPKVEVVFNLTSDESHASLARASLKAGKNVFIEKPVTLSLPSLGTIIGAEKNAPNGARPFVGHVRRYAPTFRT